VRAVPVEDYLTCLQELSTFTPCSPGWVHLKKHPYKGDTVFVVSVDPQTLLCTLYVIPWIDMQGHPPDRKRSRYIWPPQVLFDPDGVKEKYGDKSVEHCNWVYIFRRDLYTYGFLEVETEDGYVPQDTTPTCDELSLFENHPRIPPSAIKKAYDITSSLVLQHGDRVLISTGKFQGLSGVIISVDPSYANVDIPLCGMTTMIKCNHL
jgi:hypothetical protein